MWVTSFKFSIAKLWEKGEIQEKIFFHFLFILQSAINQSRLSKREQKIHITQIKNPQTKIRERKYEKNLKGDIKKRISILSFKPFPTC